MPISSSSVSFRPSVSERRNLWQYSARVLYSLFGKNKLYPTHARRGKDPFGSAGLSTPLRFSAHRGHSPCNANALRRAVARVRLKRNARLCPCKQAKPSRPFRVTKKGSAIRSCHAAAHFVARRRAFSCTVSLWRGGAVPAPRPFRRHPHPAHFAPAPIPRPAPHRRRGHGDNKSMLYDAKRFDFENNLFCDFFIHFFIAGSPVFFGVGLTTRGKVF